MLAIFFSFMSLGIFFWYMNIYMQKIRGDSLIKVGGRCSIFAADKCWLCECLLRRLAHPPGTIPSHYRHGLPGDDRNQRPLGLYSGEPELRAMAFPAMFLSSFTIDLITTSSQIIASNTVPMKHQSVAGSLVDTLLSYGMSTSLGLAGTVEVNTFENGNNLLRGYHSAAYLEVGLASASLTLSAILIRIPKVPERVGVRTKST